jgi:hypothetical protein
MKPAFRIASNVAAVALPAASGDADLSQVTDFTEMFLESLAEVDVSGSDASSVTTMTRMPSATSFNDEVGGSDTSSSISFPAWRSTAEVLGPATGTLSLRALR